jgi:hypothetical protein
MNRYFPAFCAEFHWFKLESSNARKYSSCVYRNLAQANAKNELDFVAFDWKSVFAAETLLTVKKLLKMSQKKQSNHNLYQIGRVASKNQLLFWEKSYKVY